MALASIASRCKKTGREFSLTLSDLVTPEFCPVFGTHLLYGCSRHDPNGPSLDRIDNTKGYVPGNVVVVSLRANLLKRDATLDELEKLVRFLKRTRRSGAAHTKAELDAARKFVEKREADRLLEIKAEDRRRIDHPLRKAMQAKHGSALCPYCHKTVQLIKRGVFGMHTKPGPLTGSAVRCEGFHRKPVATQKCGCPGLAHYLSCPKMAEKAKADRKRKRSKA